MAPDINYPTIFSVFYTRVPSAATHGVLFVSNVIIIIILD